jgi:hypothetical protein
MFICTVTKPHRQGPLSKNGDTMIIIELMFLWKEN